MGEYIRGSSNIIEWNVCVFVNFDDFFVQVKSAVICSVMVLVV